MIGRYAFDDCPALRRVIMRGVTVIKEAAFLDCDALTDVECDKLEIIGWCAFSRCKSLTSINMPSARRVESNAFNECRALAEAKFGTMVERIGGMPFRFCTSLERITVPLKDGLITRDGCRDIFLGCGKLNHVDLVEGELHETIAALYLEDWKRDMSAEINSIGLILSNAQSAGGGWEQEQRLERERANAVRRWIRSILRKIIHYQAEHQRLLYQAASTLRFALPQDITSNNVLPFLQLPPHTFELGDDEEELENDSEEGLNNEG